MGLDRELEVESDSGQEVESDIGQEVESDIGQDIESAYGARHGKRNGIIVGFIIGAVIVSLFFISWSEVEERFSNIEGQKFVETAEMNIEEAKKRLEPLLKDPFTPEPSAENHQEK
ncbi:MAG: hypothetical protein ACE5J2_08970 [Nitrososphaerales archaeon]